MVISFFLVWLIGFLSPVAYSHYNATAMSGLLFNQTFVFVIFKKKSAII